MKIQTRKLAVHILLLTLAIGAMGLPAGAAMAGAGSSGKGAGGSARTTGLTEARTQITANPDWSVAQGRILPLAGSSVPLVSGDTASGTAVDPSAATWKKVGGALRLQSSNGKYKTGFVKKNGVLYYFNSKGNLKTGFFTVAGKRYYASYIQGARGKGQILTGLVKIGSYYYYLNPSSKPYAGAVTTGFRAIRGRRYFFYSSGHMATGWFSIGGNTYYASCNKKGHYGMLLTGIQKIGNDTYIFNASGKLLRKVAASETGAAARYAHVIDVSEHQGSIDWAKVKADGVKAAIIRAGYGNSTTDDYFHANIKGARSAGLPVGIYWFSYAYTKQQAITEARYCMRVIKSYHISLPIYFDWEYDSMRYARQHGKKPGRSLITEMTGAFCKTITQGGYRAGYYFNLAYRNNYYNPSQLKAYSTWYAYWGTNRPSSDVWAHANTIGVPTQFDLWQFTSRGKVSGIKGNVDLNLLLRPSIKK